VWGQTGQPAGFWVTEGILGYFAAAYVFGAVCHLEGKGGSDDMPTLHTAAM